MSIEVVSEAEDEEVEAMEVSTPVITMKKETQKLSEKTLLTHSSLMLEEGAAE